MVAVARPFGEVVVTPCEVRHTASELRDLAKSLKSLDGEIRVVLEHLIALHDQAFAGVRQRLSLPFPRPSVFIPTSLFLPFCSVVT